MRTRIFSLVLLAAALGAAPPARAEALPAGIGESASLAIDGANTIDAHQYRINNARVPGATSSRQSIVAWQVVAGSWGGQTLDGLTLVLVKTTSDDAPSGMGRQVNCYVSNIATPAQRNALLGAFLAAQPEQLSPRDRAHLRVEPGVIVIDVEGGAVVLHLGLVA